MAFAPVDNTRVYANSNTAGLTTTGGCFVTALTLPAGAKVKSIQIFYKSGTGNILVEITRTSLFERRVTSLVSIQPTDASGAYRSSTVAVAATKQAVSAGYAYGLLLCQGPTDTFYGAKVKYTYTSAGS